MVFNKRPKTSWKFCIEVYFTNQSSKKLIMFFFSLTEYGQQAPSYSRKEERIYKKNLYTGPFHMKPLDVEKSLNRSKKLKPM